MTFSNRVWIELEHPGADEALGDARAALANKMLARLSEADDGDRNRFWYYGDKSCYCFGDSGGFKELSDNGFWFNLEFFGRED